MGAASPPICALTVYYLPVYPPYSDYNYGHCRLRQVLMIRIWLDFYEDDMLPWVLSSIHIQRKSPYLGCKPHAVNQLPLSPKSLLALKSYPQTKHHLEPKAMCRFGSDHIEDQGVCTYVYEVPNLKKTKLKILMLIGCLEGEMMKERWWRGESSDHVN